ncbi:MAG: dihydroneopterin aldolase [Kordiimonadaceae bacterium]|jgi:7,8-dihydroneopterin aldolase/epimerase/oxygenase|nr:dihydroneopterin aldolase [Kordiimonadaceae bacterium]MBT6031487.1 dihydroneopterin aldolase [Kordiimonadaceae bacterium]MBT6329970.1 dihydroneopterin aldolase [Kordiimonadaceae bacterium]
MPHNNYKSNLTPIKYADATRSVRHVFVRDLLLSSSIGIYDHEKEKLQNIRINIDLCVKEEMAPLNDDYKNIVCYEKVVTGIKNIVCSGHVELVETLAEKIADFNMIDPRIVSVRVRVEKLEAIENTTSVGVEIERHRDN